MLKRFCIEFKKGAVLSSDMLNTLYKQQRDIWNIKYSDFKDGIIDGLEFFEKDNNIFISSGIVKYQGEIFLTDKPINITAIIEKSKYINEGDILVITLDKGDISSHNNVTTYSLNISIKKDFTDEDFILGEILYRENILPKVDFKSFSNLIREQENYINISKRRYSVKGGITCDPVITYLFARELIQRKNLSHYDQIILALGMNKMLINPYLLVEYFNYYSLTYNQNGLISLFQKVLDIKEQNQNVAIDTFSTQKEQKVEDDIITEEDDKYL